MKGFTLGVVAMLSSAVLGCRSDPPKKAIAPKVAPPQPAVASATPPAPVAPPKLLEVTFPSRGRTLHGIISRPLGPGPFPAIIYNHGSEQHPGKYVALRTFFNAHGYTVFVPYRTGQGPSPGPYVMDQIRQTHDPARALEEQAADVGNAMKFLQTQPYVIKNRVAVAGCSFGGIETLFSAEKGFGFRAGIDWAGDAESWKNTSLRQRLMRAIDNAKMPIFFLQAENDYTTEPTRVFGRHAQRTNKDHKAKVFPVWGDPSSHQDGHGGFCVKGSASWGNDVLQFLDKNLR